MVIKRLEVSESRGPHGKKSQYEQRGQDRVLQLQRHGGLGRPPWTPHAPCSQLRMMGKGCSGEVGVARIVSSDRLSLLAHPGSTPWLIGVVPVGVIILNSGGRTALLRPAGSCRFSASLASVPSCCQNADTGVDPCGCLCSGEEWTLWGCLGVASLVLPPPTQPCGSFYKRLFSELWSKPRGLLTRTSIYRFHSSPGSVSHPYTLESL